MKQQFLDLKGLTELVSYLKDSIANKKVILPYASNTLFPSVGDINSVYIDTATNSIYRWDSTNKKYEMLAKAVKSVSISESTENGKITLTVDGVKTTVPIHGLKSAAYTESSAYATAAQGVKAESAVQSISLASGTNNGTVKLTVDGKATDNIAVKGLGSAAYTASSAYATAGHTHTKAQIGLGNVDNTADKDKSVKHATTADSATSAGTATTATNVSGQNAYTDDARHVWFSVKGTETQRAYNDNFTYNPVKNLLTTNITGSAASASSVPWTGVTGKPSTFTPSAHKHDDSTITSLNASKLFGTIDIARLPHGALERCVIVTDDDARFKLTTADVQLGDTVKVDKTKTMYFVINESKLNSEEGYTIYTAGTATSVPWSGVTGKPSTFTPSAHTHPYLSALSVSGKTITYTKGDGTTGTITTQDTWRGIQNNLTSDSATDSLAAAQGKVLKGLVDTKLPHTTLTTAVDFNTLTTTGIYHIKFSGATNQPHNAHGTLFVDFNVGTPYQLWFTDYNDVVYKRKYASSTWSAWTQWKVTDTVYTHPSYTEKTSGLYNITVDKTGHISAATLVTKADITALGIPASDTNTWRGIQNNLTSDSASDSLAAAQGKVLKGLVDGKLSLSGGVMTGNISYKGSKATYPMIQFIDNDVDAYGNGIAIGGGGLTIVGGGEAADVVKTTATHGGNERLILANDDSIEFYTSCQGGLSKATHTSIDNTGLFSGIASSANLINCTQLTNQDLNTLKDPGKFYYAAGSNNCTNTGQAVGTAFGLYVGRNAEGYRYQKMITTGNLIYYRTYNSTSWGAWSTNIDSANYNSYAPTKTGTGASGTWGISVTGNAATATKLATARSINGTNFDGSGNITTATWGTARNVTIGNTKKSVNGSADVSWSLSEIGAAASSHTHSYLPLSGGTMAGTAMITWPDSGNWSNKNNGVTFPVSRGGLSWSGQSDGIQLYAVETGNDNLELYLRFSDDNSNGLSIRNKDNAQTARIAADGTITASSFVGNLSGTASAAPWSGITGKPTTYPPSSHTHAYLPLAGGTMTGVISSSVATATHLAGNKGTVIINSTAADGYNMLARMKSTNGVWTLGNYTKGFHLYYTADSTISAGTNTVTKDVVLLNESGDSAFPGTVTAAKFSGPLNGNASTATNVAWTGVTGKPDTYPPSSHTHAYLPLAGGTMSGALNFANNTWNVVGDDVAIGDMNIGGKLGIMGKNGNTGIKLVQNGASTTSGSSAPGVTWVCTGDGVSTMSGTLSGTFKGNLSGTATAADYPTGFSSRTTGATWGNQTGTFLTGWHTSAGGDIQFRDNSGQLNVIIDGVFYQNEGRNLVLDSSNYTSYTTTKTGGGASGTWSINVTGSAGSVAWGNVSGKPSTFAPSSHTHNYAGSGSAGGSANSAVKLDTTTAGSATQPVYFSGGKPVACTYTLAKSVPADAKFTDTNTWRGVQNNLTSTATDQSLAAAQGKVLNEKKMSAVSANGYYGMARPDNNTSDWIRTTTNGLLPVQSGGRGSGHSGLGTSSWYFSSSYIDHMYSTDVKIADKVTLQYDSTNACLNFVFS